MPFFNDQVIQLAKGFIPLQRSIKLEIKMAALLLLLCVAVTSVAAQNVRCGHCPEPKTDEDFKLTKVAILLFFSIGAK